MVHLLSISFSSALSWCCCLTHVQNFILEENILNHGLCAMRTCYAQDPGDLKTSAVVLLPLSA